MQAITFRFTPPLPIVFSTTRSPTNHFRTTHVQPPLSSKSELELRRIVVGVRRLDTGFIALTSLLPTMDWINVLEILWQHDEWLSEGNVNEHIVVDVGRIWVSPRFARVLMRQAHQVFTKQSLENIYIATPIGSPQHSPFGQMFDAEDGGLIASSFVTLAGPPLPANPMSRRAAPTWQFGRRGNVFNRGDPALFGGEDEHAEKLMAGELVSDVSLDWLRVTKQKHDWTCNFILAQGSECKQPTDIIGPL
jgi:hypothetical protein